MQLLGSSTKQDPDIVTGTQSDGSDRQIIPGPTRYRVRVLHEGQVYDLDFDHSPSDDDIAAAIPAPADVNPTRTSTKAALLPIAKQRISEYTLYKTFAADIQADANLAAEFGITAQQATNLQAAAGNVQQALYQRAVKAFIAYELATA